PKTFELIQAQTIAADNTDILDLQFIHDPVGNISAVKKRVGLIEQAHGQPLTLVSEYDYDALYQLIKATGVELGAPANPEELPPLQAYTQRFEYDDGRNLHRIEHEAAGNTDVTEMVVSDTSNRAVSKEFAVDAQSIDTLFDRGGNQLQLRPQAPIKWNY